jgi:hypothetical protein
LLLIAGSIDVCDGRGDTALGAHLAGHVVDSHRSTGWSHSCDRQETSQTKTEANFYRTTDI